MLYYYMPNIEMGLPYYDGVLERTGLPHVRVVDSHGNTTLGFIKGVNGQQQIDFSLLFDKDGNFLSLPFVGPNTLYHRNGNTPSVSSVGLVLDLNGTSTLNPPETPAQKFRRLSQPNWKQPASTLPPVTMPDTAAAGPDPLPNPLSPVSAMEITKPITPPTAITEEPPPLPVLDRVDDFSTAPTQPIKVRETSATIIANADSKPAVVQPEKPVHVDKTSPPKKNRLKNLLEKIAQPFYYLRDYNYTHTRPSILEEFMVEHRMFDTLNSLTPRVVLTRVLPILTAAVAGAYGSAHLVYRFLVYLLKHNP